MNSYLQATICVFQNALHLTDLTATHMYANVPIFLDFRPTGPLAASVILLPDVIESLGGQQGDIMACIPATDLCMIGDTRNVKHICVISEIALKFLNKPRFLSTQPLRLVKKEWKIFEANRADDEHPFPKSADEVKILKRALRMQGKI